MKILCKIGLHKWTEDNKLSRLMIGEFGNPFGCSRCGNQKDEWGHKFPAPVVHNNDK